MEQGSSHDRGGWSWNEHVKQENQLYASRRRVPLAASPSRQHRLGSSPAMVGEQISNESHIYTTAEQVVSDPVSDMQSLMPVGQHSIRRLPSIRIRQRPHCSLKAQARQLGQSHSLPHLGPPRAAIPTESAVRFPGARDHGLMATKPFNNPMGPTMASAAARPPPPDMAPVGGRQPALVAFHADFGLPQIQPFGGSNSSPRLRHHFQSQQCFTQLQPQGTHGPRGGWWPTPTLFDGILTGAPRAGGAWP